MLYFHILILLRVSSCSLSTLCDEQSTGNDRKCRRHFFVGIHDVVFLRCHSTYAAGMIRLPRPPGHGTVTIVPY